MDKNKKSKNKKSCKHNGGKGYWYGVKGCICLKCGKELNIKK